MMMMARKGMLLPTTTTTDCKASGAAGYSTESGRHAGVTLTDVVVRGFLPTPVASDQIGGVRTHDGKRGQKLSDLIRGGMLPTTTTARDCKGVGFREDTLPNRVGHGIGNLRLNPRFVEWMMNFPIGWTEIGPIGSTPSATPSSRSAPSMPSSPSGTGSTIRRTGVGR